MSFTIAIDGPSGAGKSTVARGVATRLGITYLDTGAMYRAVAVVAARTGADAAVVARTISLELGTRVIANGDDVTEAIRTPEASQDASRFSAISEVREALVALQRQILASGQYVAEGRDIGTVVAPTAQAKIFLTADPAERARRRAAQLGLPVEQILAEQQERDERDTNREHSPLRPADDAYTLDASHLSAEQVIERICTLAVERGLRDAS